MTLVTCDVVDCLFNKHAECQRALTEIMSVSGTPMCASYQYGGATKLKEQFDFVGDEPTTEEMIDDFGIDQKQKATPIWEERGYGMYSGYRSRYVTRQPAYEPEEYPMTRTDAAAKHQIDKHGKKEG